MNLNANEAGRLVDVLLSELEEVGGRLAPGPFGRYRITRLIGVGGMGEVYEAEQENPARRVAIKVVRPELISPGALKRFEHETRMLARLQHPGIAPIYEAGQVEAGGGRTPFFAMEYVEGRPLTEFAASQKLGVRARLELFLKVCEAVEHAHQRGVIHRDLKPGNVLVDAAGRPRVMDFGVARATDSDVQATTIATEVGRLVGTLPYMSPEQVGGDAEELDTRSDVYSLGVVLYELLGSRLPYDVKGSGGGRIAEAVRAIRESEPAPLSSVDRVFRGDLETIVGRALEKERGRRYQSVGELAADIRRYLADEPIVARRPSTWYQVRKFAKRNRGVAWGTGLGFIMLIGSTALSLWFGVAEAQARRDADKLGQREAASRESAEQSRDAAEHHAAVTDRAIEFIAGVFLAASPHASGGVQRTPLELLDIAAKQAEARTSDDPKLESAIHLVLAKTYRMIGEPAKALPHAERAVRVATNVSGEEDSAALNAASELAAVKGDLGSPEEAIEILRHVVATRDRTLGSDDQATLRSKSNLGVALLGRGELEEGAKLLQEVADGPRPADPGDAYMSMLNLAAARFRQGQFPEAQRILTENIVLARRDLGDSHPVVLESQSLLAGVYLEQDRIEDSIRVTTDLVGTQTLILGAEHPDTLLSMFNLAGMLIEAGRAREAGPWIDRVCQSRASKLGALHPSTIAARAMMARKHRAEGRPEEGVAMLRTLLDTVPADHSDRQLAPNVHGLIGEFLTELNDHAGAEEHLLASWKFFFSEYGPENARFRLACQRLVQLYESSGEEEKAAVYRAHLGHGSP